MHRLSWGKLEQMLQLSLYCSHAQVLQQKLPKLRSRAVRPHSSCVSIQSTPGHIPVPFPTCSASSGCCGCRFGREQAGSSGSNRHSSTTWHGNTRIATCNDKSDDKSDSTDMYWPSTDSTETWNVKKCQENPRNIKKICCPRVGLWQLRTNPGISEGQNPQHCLSLAWHSQRKRESVGKA